MKFTLVYNFTHSNYLFYAVAYRINCTKYIYIMKYNSSACTYVYVYVLVIKKNEN